MEVSQAETHTYGTLLSHTVWTSQDASGAATNKEECYKKMKVIRTWRHLLKQCLIHNRSMREKKKWVKISLWMLLAAYSLWMLGHKRPINSSWVAWVSLCDAENAETPSDAWVHRERCSRLYQGLKRKIIGQRLWSNLDFLAPGSEKMAASINQIEALKPPVGNHKIEIHISLQLCDAELN